MTQGSPTVTINKTQGTGPSWIRAYIKGPVVNPQIQFTGLFNQANPITIKVLRSIAAGQLLEINAEPWSGRTVLDTGENLAADTIDYLDKMRFWHNRPMTAVFGGTGMTSQTQCVLAYKDAYQTV